MIFFCLVRVACQTVSVFYFPTKEVATCSPRLPILKQLTIIMRIQFFVFDLSSFLIIIIIIIIHNLYSAALLKDPAALYNNDNVNIKSVR